MNEDQGNSELGEPGAESQLTGCRRQAEKIAFENKMLRAVVDSMPDNISIKDLQGRYIFDNSSHCRFLGATNPTEVVGKTVFDFLPAGVAAKFHAEDLQVLRSGTAVQSEHESIDSAGNQVWMLVTKMP
ncbi:MAG: PAS domain-containing protein, partial [Verrucomicrobia bacterium]|nr:PAS domain-containing protein [Verrucomicrobiota bacterium]